MQLLWFRQDLRLNDHVALWHATQQGQTCALVILSPEQWALHDDADIKIDFYLRQLAALQLELQQLNIPLIILTIQLWKDIPEAMNQICTELNIQTVHANIEFGVNELKRDFELQQLLEKNNIAVELYHDRTLFPVGTIRNTFALPYKVFSAFKKNGYERLTISLPSCYPKPEKQKPQLQGEHLPQIVPSFEQLMGRTPICSSVKLWPVTEIHAHHLLNDFIEHKVHHYPIQRDFPDLDGSSQLSPYLNIGIVSIRQCVQALFHQQQGHFHFDYTGQHIWLDELLWREFYQHILFDFPQVSKHLPFKDNTLNLPWRDDATALQAWQTGQTGIPIVDAGIRQMLSTGWMHNRVRMIVAMFLCKNLLIDWRLGEQWFMQHLIDGDLAANNGGWQWCASTGTDAVPYFRIFNPISQSQKFDPQGDYIRKWVPELAHLDTKQIHEPYAKNSEIQLNYPKPIIDLKQSRLRALEAFKAL
jgi:deoxyribodipyrimidine photo-lyase